MGRLTKLRLAVPDEKPPGRTVEERLAHLAPGGQPIALRQVGDMAKPAAPASSYTAEQRSRFRALALRCLALSIGLTSGSTR